MEMGDLSRFPFLSDVGDENRPQFVKILKNLVLNLNVRFFNVGFSLDKKNIKRFLDYENATILPGAPVGDMSRCGLSPMLELFNTKQSHTTTHLSTTLPHLGVHREWARLLPLFAFRRGLIDSQAEQRILSSSLLERRMRQTLASPVDPNLVDFFNVISRSDFPRLWKFVMMVLTILPTSVGCEQSFSYYKRTAHINMSDENAKNLMSRLFQYECNYNL